MQKYAMLASGSTDMNMKKRLIELCTYGERNVVLRNQSGDVINEKESKKL